MRKVSPPSSVKQSAALERVYGMSVGMMSRIVLYRVQSESESVGVHQ